MTTNPHPMDSLVGANLRRLRIKASVTQVELAAKIGVSFQQVQKYERGVNRLSASILWECAQARGIRLSSLFARSPRPRNDNRS